MTYFDCQYNSNQLAKNDRIIYMKRMDFWMNKKTLNHRIFFEPQNRGISNRRTEEVAPLFVSTLVKD
jgi:hypothetical protein